MVTHNRVDAPRGKLEPIDIVPILASNGHQAEAPSSLDVLAIECLSPFLQEHTSITPEALVTALGGIDQSLTELIPDTSLRSLILPDLADVASTYIQACAEALPEALKADVSRRARSHRNDRLKEIRKDYLVATARFVRVLNTSKKLGLKKNDLPWQRAFIGIERAADAMEKHLATCTRAGKKARQATDEPLDSPGQDAAKLKAAYLLDNGYEQRADGLYAIRFTEDGNVAYKVFDGYVDVLVRRCVFTVPDRVEQKPQEYGVVHVAYLKNLNTHKGQTLEIHRADILSRQPQFWGRMHTVKPPHNRKKADFTDALEALGQYAPIENRFNATGLVRTHKGLVFLHPANGAITDTGEMDNTYRVQFNLKHDATLKRCSYGWERMSASTEQVTDYQTLMQIGDVAPGSIGYGDVLLGACGFTPFSQMCETGGVHGIVHGPSGSLKSATARLVLQGYALIDGRNEISTANLADGKTTVFALEQMEYYLPGMFALNDDALKGKGISDKDKKDFYKLMSARGRHAVERQGADKGTWNSGDTGFAIAFYPRGSSITTVEILPDSEDHTSDLARYALVSLDSIECVDVPLLTELQERSQARAMNRATASYIQWLLSRMPDFLAKITEKEEAYRACDVHSRTPTTYAKLETGMEALLQYGVFIGAHTEEDAAMMLQSSRERLLAIALTQKALMGIDEHHKQANNPVDIFYTLLRQGLHTGKLYASDALYRTSGSDKVNRPRPPICLEDELPDTWGWKFNESQGVYEPHAKSYEAGVLKHEPGTPLSLHMYVRNFKERIYPALKELGDAQDIPMPGLNEMIDKLKKAGKMESTNPTHLHGRESRTGSCYILDMSPSEDEPLGEKPPADEPKAPKNQPEASSTEPDAEIEQFTF